MKERKGPVENRFFHALHRVHLEKTIYPFTLCGEAYLNSGWKRTLDLTFGTVGLLPSLFLIAVGAGAIKVESPGLPALITQDRHGRKGTFPMFKIRSQANNTSESGAISPTRVGAILRRLSIDELPQIINVMRGDMAVVGKRPVLDFDLIDLERRFLGELPYRLARTHFGFTDEQWMNGELPEGCGVKEVEEYADGVREATKKIWERFAQNNHSRPGLTGLYQILGRRAIRPEHRVKLDNFYEKHASLGLDLAIILATIPAIFSRRGAK